MKSIINSIKNHFNNYHFPYQVFPIIGLLAVEGMLVCQIMEGIKAGL